MSTETYQCCFCGRQIADRGPDPCSLSLEAKFTARSDEHVPQGFFCHLKCFEERLCPSVPLYLKDLLEDKTRD